MGRGTLEFEAAFQYGFLAGAYIFYLHDRALHARFDALDKRVAEIRKRLAIEY